MLMEATCLYGSMHPSNLANSSRLKFSWTGTSHISSDGGLGIQYFHFIHHISFLPALVNMKNIIFQGLVMATKVVHRSEHLQYETFNAVIFFGCQSSRILVHHDMG